MKPARQRKCKECGTKFQPWSTTQTACSPKCAQALAQKAAERRRKRDTREARQSIKTRGEWLKEAQAAFNAWVRLRDEADPCIACGRHHQGQWHAGHYRSVGSCPELRFEPVNVHKCCMPCNTHLSGNLIEYRLRLIDKIGQAKVDWLEGLHEPKRYTIEQIKAIRDDYRGRVRDMRKGG